MILKNLLSFFASIIICIILVLTITDAREFNWQLYNFGAFYLIFFFGTFGITAISLLWSFFKKNKIDKKLIGKVIFRSSLLLNIFLLGMGIYFYDGLTPKEYSGNRYVYNYVQPENYNDGILTGNISESSLSPDTLKSIMEKIVNDPDYHGMNSFLLWNKGRLITEEYFYDFTKDTRQDIRSATKSITSLLFGIALDKGFIKSPDEKISQYFPEYFKNYDKSSEKFEITIRDLLNMHSCLDCNDWDRNSPGQEDKLYKTDDWIKSLLDVGTIEKDSVYARYCTGGVNVIGEIISRTSGMKLDTFADKYLFKPLGISNYNFSYTPKGRTEAGGHIYFTSRDLLKLGILVANNGTWNDQQIISSDWINKIYMDNVKMPDPRLKYPGYGFLWWKINFGFKTKGIQALGNGGQLILVFPELETVIVFTGSNFNNYRMLSPFKIVEESILPNFMK